MIRLSGVSKAYRGQQPVLDRVDLEVGRGDFLYVLGGSGAGKSTLLRLVATEEAPSSGSVRLMGYDPSAVAPALLRALRRSLGIIPQDVRLLPDLSVSDTISLSVALAGRRALGGDARARLDELQERLGLGKLRDRPASALSGGEAQRVAVARALVRNPELIVADEPTGMQDREYAWVIMDLLARANAGGATVLVATHDREVVRRFRKRCVFLGAGKLAPEEAQCIY